MEFDLDAAYRHIEQTFASFPPLAANAAVETARFAVEQAASGAEPLHAAAVASGDAAALVIAGPGIGKSTLAARLLLDHPGLLLLADDVTPLHRLSDGTVVAARGSVPLRVASDVAGRLVAAFGGTTAETSRNRVSWTPPAQRLAGDSSRPALVVFLDPEAKAPVRTRGNDALTCLLAATFVRKFDTPVRARRRMEILASIARDVPCVRAARDDAATLIADRLLGVSR